MYVPVLNKNKLMQVMNVNALGGRFQLSIFSRKKIAMKSHKNWDNKLGTSLKKLIPQDQFPPLQHTFKRDKATAAIQGDSPGFS